MAEAAELSGGAPIPQPAENAVGIPLRRGPRSVLRVSQLLLRAIAAHRRPTLATLRRELGSAGYEVRRKVARRAGEASAPETKGTLLRVSGSDAAGYFRIWKVPKPKRKPGRPRQVEGVRSSGRGSRRSRTPRRRRSQRKAAKKAREAWRRKARALEKARRARLRAKDQARARARPRATDRDRRRASREEARTRSQNARKPGSKSGEDKRQEPEKSVRRTIQKPAEAKADGPAGVQGKVCAKTSADSEAPVAAAGGP